MEDLVEQLADFPRSSHRIEHGPSQSARDLVNFSQTLIG